MMYVGLFILSSIAMLMYMGAGLHLAALDAKKNRHNEPSGSSIFPVIPIIPAAVTSAAWALNFLGGNIGFWVCYSLGLLVFAGATGVIILAQYKMKRLERT